MSEIRRPKAFISCSLHREDQPFVNYVIAIANEFGLEPMGTIGRFGAAPKPIWQQMRDGINESDCIIIVATPRYIQQDIFDKGKTGQGISEMIHTEVGMAILADRPVLAFVQEGTNVGGLLPQVTQVMTLRPYDQFELTGKWPLIGNYFRSAFAIIQERWRTNNLQELLKGVGIILGFIGSATIINAVFGVHEEYKNAS